MEEPLFDRITFCLVRPENPGNIGSAARAMKNMGFSRLALASPSDPRGEESIRMAYRSRDILNTASLYPDLPSALADARWIVGLTGRKEHDHTLTQSIEELASEVWAHAEKGKVILLFGPEGTGLNNEELSRCHRTAFIPTGEIFSSLNLAQAVLIVAYILLQGKENATLSGSSRTLAPTQEIEPFFIEMESTLEQIGFLKSPAKKEMVRKLRALFTRAELDEKEVKILRAMFRQVLWASEDKPSEKRL
jgi:tRNA (cytidine32/uridine32-2'-O)-methyltransferase